MMSSNPGSSGPPGISGAPGLPLGVPRGLIPTTSSAPGAHGGLQPPSQVRLIWNSSFQLFSSEECFTYRDNV